MIKTSPHGQIFLDHIIVLYMDITVSWNEGMRDIFENHFLSKRTPIIKELCSGFWSIFGQYYLKISMPWPRFRFLVLDDKRDRHKSIMEPVPTLKSYINGHSLI